MPTLFDKEIHSVKTFLYDYQTKLCQKFSQEEKNPDAFLVDHWERTQGGGGKTCVIENGLVIERGGVNVSHVFDTTLPTVITQKRPELSGYSYEAMGISLVMHPVNPFVPTTHMNLRFFIAKHPKNPPIWWFGGGFDLTPYYGFESDCIHWHRCAKAACDPYGPQVYESFKQQCDDYFFLKHRNEPRGIGGIFFDDLNAWGFENCFLFIQNVGEKFVEAYFPIVTERKKIPYQSRHRDFQAYRRGRYVEFNLIYDRGTIFGLQSNGRTESILMSLPPHVTWKYAWHPAEGSEEEKLYKEFLVPKNWS